MKGHDIEKLLIHDFYKRKIDHIKQKTMFFVEA